MTLADIESQARTLVNDIEEPYRFAQADIFRFAVDAVRELRNISPGEKYDPATGNLDDSYPATLTEDTELRFDSRFTEAVVAYVGYRIYQLDMTDTVNLQVAENLKARAETLMRL